MNEARRRIAKLVRQMEDDNYPPRSVVARLKDLECEEDRIVQEITNLPERIVLRPANSQALCRVAISELEQHLVTREASASRCDPDVSRRRCGSWWQR